MIALAGLLILVAGALLVGGLGNGETTLLWGSVGVSALAAVALVLQSVRRARAARAEDDDEPALVGAAAPAAGASTPAAPAVAAGAPGETARPSSPASGGPTTSSGRTASGEPPASGEPSAAEVAALRAELAELRSERFGAATSHADVEPAAAEAPAAEPTTIEPPAATRADGPVPAVPAPAGAVPGGSAAGGSDADEEPAADVEPAADEPARAVAAAAVAPAARTASEGPTTGTHAVVRPIVVGEDGEPVEEDVVVTDLLLVIDLTDEVFVVDEHPRYHLEGCAVTEGQDTLGLPLDEAKGDGFTACGICRPDRSLADAERRRRAAARS